MITLEAYRAAVGNWYLRRGMSSSRTRIKYSEPLKNQCFCSYCESKTDQQIIETYTTGIVLLTALFLLPIVWTTLTMRMLAKKGQQEDVPYTETIDNVCLTALMMLSVLWTTLMMMVIAMKREKVVPDMEMTRGLNGTSVWYDKTGKINIPPLKGGGPKGRISENDMCSQAIRSAWRHGINLKRGRENPAAGNCSIEVRIFGKPSVQKYYKSVDMFRSSFNPIMAVFKPTL